jgi:hypothetical protein
MNTIVQNPTRQKCFTEAVFVAPLLIAAHLKALLYCRQEKILHYFLASQINKEILTDLEGN